MLELQELLVKAGYVDDYEAQNGQGTRLEQRMQKAVEVFYEYILNQNSEFISPQTSDLVYAAVPAHEGSQSKPRSTLERQNQINAGTLAGILVGA